MFLFFSEANMKGTVPLISLSICNLYLERLQFCVLILYHATLLKEFTGHRHFLVESLGSFLCKTYHLQTKILGLLSFLFVVP